MPPPAEGRSGAYSVSPRCYVRTCVRAYVTRPKSNNIHPNVRAYVNAYVRASLRAYNFGTSYITKLKLGMMLTWTKTFGYIVEIPLGHAPGWG